MRLHESISYEMGMECMNDADGGGDETKVVSGHQIIPPLSLKISLLDLRRQDLLSRHPRA